MAVAKKEQEWIVTVSPHIRNDETVSRIMWTVSLSLLPAFVSGVYFFGPRAVYVTALCIIGAFFSEWLVEKMTGKEITISDGSAFLTGLLLGMNLPSSAPFYIPLVSSFVAVAITKQLFGGLGYNIFNPALIGRAFALIAWPRAMTTWLAPTAAFVGLDAKTTATPLSILKEGGMQKLIEVFGDKTNLYTDLLLGHRAGSLGETSVRGLSPLQAIHHLAYTPFFPRNRSCYGMDIWRQSGVLYRGPRASSPKRRIDARSHFHGH